MTYPLKYLLLSSKQSQKDVYVFLFENLSAQMNIITASSQPVRQSSIDEETRQKLEKRLSERPDKNELVERNILKGATCSKLLNTVMGKYLQMARASLLDSSLPEKN